MSIHDVRVFNFAVIDIVLTFIAVFVVYKKFNKHRYSLLAISLLFFAIAIIVHYLMGIDTTLNYFLGLSNKPVRYRSGFKIVDVVPS